MHHQSRAIHLLRTDRAEAVISPLVQNSVRAGSPALRGSANSEAQSAHLSSKL